MRSSVRWIAVLATVVTTLALCAFSAGADVRYEVIDLGAGDGSSAFAINDPGQIIGYQAGAYLWNNGVISRPGIEFATSINNNGVVVGRNSTMSGSQAAVWQDDTTTTLPNGLYNASGVNDSGQIVGNASYESTSPHPYLYDNDTVTMLDELAGYSYGAANHINNNGQIAGWVATDSPDEYACIWNGSTLQMLGFNGAAHDINDSGVVIGNAVRTNNRDGTDRAFIWENNTRVDLGIVGFALSNASAINNNGQVVGYCYNYEWDILRSKAFVYENGVMSDLNTLIDSDSGWNLALANDINNNGQIVGSGLYNGSMRAFLLNPVPEPASLLALASGLAGLVLMRRRR